MTGIVEALWITIDVSFSLIKVRPTSLVIKQIISNYWYNTVTYYKLTADCRHGASAAWWQWQWKMSSWWRPEMKVWPFWGSARVLP